MNITIQGKRLGITPDIGDLDEDIIINNPIFTIEHNNINPTGFIISIEDGEEILNIRIDNHRMKTILKHVIDDL